MWWRLSPKGYADTLHDSYGFYEAAFTSQSSIDFDFQLGLSQRRRTCTQKFSVWQMTLSVLAATDWKVMQSGYTWFRCVTGVESYVNNDRLLVEISHWIEYACGVKYETITLNRKVGRSGALTSFLTEDIFGCVLQVSLEKASGVIGYYISTRYCLDSLGIHGWAHIYCARYVSGESRGW
jgi:hypothetical protein